MSEEVGSPSWRRLAESQRLAALATADRGERDELLSYWAEEFGRRLAVSPSVPKLGPVLGTDPPRALIDRVPGEADPD